MAFHIPRIRSHLQKFEIKTLFIEELGWDRHAGTGSLSINQIKVTPNAIAQKRGLVVYLYQGNIPDYPTRRAIERQIAKTTFEHLINYTDSANTLQTWQWSNGRQRNPPHAVSMRIIEDSLETPSFRNSTHSCSDWKRKSG